MLGRKAATRRHRHLRDRGNPTNPPPTYTHSRPIQPTSPPDNRPTVTFLWPDPSRTNRHVVLVASFDGWLHHRMSPPSPLPTNVPQFSLSLRVPPGTHTYKFLVDSVWRTDPSARHPVRLTSDGVKHHVLTVPSSDDPPPQPLSPLPAVQNPIADRRVAPTVTLARLSEQQNRASTAVFRSASASAVPSMRIPGAATSSTSLHEAQRPRRKVEVAPRGSSFNAPPTVGLYSQTQTANRKSLLQRVGYGWIKRFSSRLEESAVVKQQTVEEGCGQDRSTAGLFRSGKEQRMSLFPSASDPNVGAFVKDGDKENSFKNWSTPTTPNRGGSRRGTSGLRGSARNVSATVSRPTKVDVPRDRDEVNRQADNWRQMARHLQDDLCDPKGARELFSRAILHREKHGLWCSAQNAQVHVDLARNLSKAEQMKDAEFHLRIALRIYGHIDAAHEHIADLQLYVGVVVDRQKRRIEAEELYRQALAIYKKHRVVGNNVDIAIKNLSLNLRKQNREAEIEGIRREFSVVKSSSVIV